MEGPGFLSYQNLSQTGAGVFVLDRLELGPELVLSRIVRYERVANKLRTVFGPAGSICPVRSRIREGRAGSA